MINNEILGTIEWLVAELARGHLVDRARLAPLVDEFRVLHPDSDSLHFAEFLVERSAVTPYQIEKVIDGESEELGLGPYVLAEPIGAGGMGVVYRAEGRAERRTYAIKVLPPCATENLRLTRRQVRAFAEMPPHPAVIPCIDVGAVGERHYLVWPFVAGETLEDYVGRHGPLAGPDAVRLALDLADVLHLTHEHDLFHGSIKPSNVMIGDDGIARLLDFGSGALLAEDDGKCLGARDQIGLGQVILFALSGRFTHAFPDSVPAELVEVLDRLLAEAPADRYRDFGELVRDLQPAVDVTLPLADPTNVGHLDALHDTPTDLPRLRPRPPVTPARSAAPADVDTPSLFRRVLGRLVFWRPPRDPVAVSILAPPTLTPGATSTLAIFTHGKTREIQALGKTYFPGHALAGSVTLRRPVMRGERLTAHLALPGLTVEPSVQKFVWAGQTLPLPCAVQVPSDFRPGEIVGVLSLARGGDVVLNHEFRVVVSDPVMSAEW
jgi:hypothetical protein